VGVEVGEVVIVEGLVVLEEEAVEEEVLVEVGKIVISKNSNCLIVQKFASLLLCSFAKKIINLKHTS
jgi:hypothetical protein